MSGGVEEGKDHLPGMLLGDQEASEKTGCVVGHYLKGRISVCTLREDVFFFDGGFSDRYLLGKGQKTSDVFDVCC